MRYFPLTSQIFHLKLSKPNKGKEFRQIFGEVLVTLSSTTTKQLKFIFHHQLILSHVQKLSVQNLNSKPDPQL